MLEINISLNIIGAIGIPVFVVTAFYLSFLLGRAYERKNLQEQ